MTVALVVDDSQFMRTVVGNALEHAGFDVVEASDGADAVEQAETHDPDVITMDVAMPEMDGIEATERIMNRNPTPILMVSAHTDKGADATLDALERGAVDFLAKPGGQEVSLEAEDLADDLLEKVNAVMGADLDAIDPVESPTPAEMGATRQGEGDAVSMAADATTPQDAAESGPTAQEITSVIEETIAGDYARNPTVVLGASTGGPKLLTAVLGDLPRALDARVLVVQHMPESFTERFAERLDAVSAYDVAEAEDGERIGGGEVRLARGGSHLEVAGYSSGRLRLQLTDAEPVHGVRPAIDVTMETAAEQVDDPLVGVAMTGMGSDAAAGIRAIKEAGGTTIVQDEETSPVFGIPQKAIATGRVDEVLPADELVDGILSALSTEGDTDG
ncbi:MAG: chemotaxis-specific protein-glutamate methyltransferase CheB [Halobacteriales archaeon]